MFRLLLGHHQAFFETGHQFASSQQCTQQIDDLFQRRPDDDLIKVETCSLLHNKCFDMLNFIVFVFYILVT